MEGSLVLLIFLVKPILPSYGLCPKNLLSIVSDGFLERRPFPGATFGGKSVSEIYVKQLLKLGKSGLVFQSGSLVGNLNNLGLVYVNL